MKTPLKEITFTVQEVADLLNVSYSFVVKLIEDKKLIGGKVENNIVIAKTEALEFKQKSLQTQQEALETMTREGQKLNLY